MKIHRSQLATCKLNTTDAHAKCLHPSVHISSAPVCVCDVHQIEQTPEAFVTQAARCSTTHNPLGLRAALLNLMVPVVRGRWHVLGLTLGFLGARDLGAGDVIQVQHVGDLLVVLHIVHIPTLKGG
jgi:hypothetical protein